MGLEDTDAIDLIVRRPGDKLLLLITDSGVTSDPDQRLALYHQKLAAYAEFISSDQFISEYPTFTPESVTIRAVCRQPPTAKMRTVTSVEIMNLQVAIPVEFEVLA